MVHDTTTADRRRERRITELLDEALELVVTEGLDGLTVGALAQRMDWTRGAMYRYFRSKDQLVAALNRRVLEDWTTEIDAVLAPLAPSEPLVQLRAGMDAFIRLAHERPAQFGLVSLTLADPRNLVENIDDATHIPAMMALLGSVVRRVAAAQDCGALAPGDPFARTLRLVFATQGVLQLRKLARFDATAFDTRNLARRTVADLLVAWGASPAAVEPR